MTCTKCGCEMNHRFQLERGIELLIHECHCGYMSATNTKAEKKEAGR